VHFRCYLLGGGVGVAGVGVFFDRDQFNPEVRIHNSRDGSRHDVERGFVESRLEDQ
jgi:hypothetical protein